MLSVCFWRCCRWLRIFDNVSRLQGTRNQPNQMSFKKAVTLKRFPPVSIQDFLVCATLCVLVIACTVHIICVQHMCTMCHVYVLCVVCWRRWSVLNQQVLVKLMSSKNNIFYYYWAELWSFLYTWVPIHRFWKIANKLYCEVHISEQLIMPHNFNLHATNV